mgnify:CR=1 FL=1
MRGTGLLSRYRRKREGKTDYRRRLRLLKSGRPRLVVRTSNRYLFAQLVVYSPGGDLVLAQAGSKDLQKLGWRGDEDNLAAAYLTGLLLAKRSMEKIPGQERVIPDVGMHAPHPGGRVYALLMGASQGGLPIQLAEEMMVDESRIRLEQLASYAAELKSKDPGRYSKMFSRYLVRGLEPISLPSHFEEIKKVIGGQDV